MGLTLAAVVYDLRVARVGQRVVTGDRLPDRISVGVLAKVVTPERVDRAVAAAGGW